MNSKEKPVFFIYEVLLKGLSNEQKQYQLKGRLISKDKMKIESMSFKLPPCGEWVGEPKIYRCIDGKKKLEESRTLQTIDKNLLKIDSGGLQIGENYSYDIEGNYVTIKEDDTYESLKDDTYKSLKISLSRRNEVNKNIGITGVKVIKCPNIRTNWLLFYIFFSIFALFISVFSLIIGINNYWDYFLNADTGLKNVLIGYFILVLLGVLLFIQMIVKCVSQYIILIKMQKFGIPHKTKIVSNTLLVPKIIEFITGTEDVDNLV